MATNCIETPTVFGRYTVPNATAVALNTLMKLSGANTNTAYANTGMDSFAGIAWEEKTTSDGLTNLTLAKNGVWGLVVATGAIATCGYTAKLSGAGVVCNAEASDLLIGNIVGQFEQSGTAGETVRTRVGAF